MKVLFVAIIFLIPMYFWYWITMRIDRIFFDGRVNTIMLYLFLILAYIAHVGSVELGLSSIKLRCAVLLLCNVVRRSCSKTPTIALNTKPESPRPTVHLPAPTLLPQPETSTIILNTKPENPRPTIHLPAPTLLPQPQTSTRILSTKPESLRPTT